MKYNNTIAQGMKANFSGKKHSKMDWRQSERFNGNTAFIGDVTLYISDEFIFHSFSLYQTWSNNQSQHVLLYGGVSLSISLNLKLFPGPYASPKWPISREDKKDREGIPHTHPIP